MDSQGWELRDPSKAEFENWKEKQEQTKWTDAQARIQA